MCRPRQMMVGTAQKFPAGPVEVPADRRPKLLLEWTMTFRMMLDNPAEAIPPRRLIARQYMAGDITGGSCWAIYNKVGLPPPKHCRRCAREL